MKSEPNVKVDVFAPAEEAQLHLNVTKPPLDKLKVRQALSLAINQNQMVAVPGRGIHAAGPVGRAFQQPRLHRRQRTFSAMIRARPRQLLKEAGYPNGFTIPMINSQDTQLANLGQLVQAQLGAIGVKVDIKPVEHATYHQLIRKDASPMVIYSAARFPVADVYLTQFFYGPSAIGKPSAGDQFQPLRRRRQGDQGGQDRDRLRPADQALARGAEEDHGECLLDPAGGNAPRLGTQGHASTGATT